jgi:hypothetical protein
MSRGASSGFHPTPTPYYYDVDERILSRAGTVRHPARRDLRENSGSPIHGVVSSQSGAPVAVLDIGQLIAKRQEGGTRGRSGVESLAKDLQAEFPAVTGFSEANF